MANKKWTVAVVAGTVLAASYPASAWYFGKRIEAGHAEIDAKIAATSYVKLVKHEYVRELFNATEVVTIELPAALLQTFTMAMLPAPGTAGAPQEGPPAQAAQATTPLAPPIRITMKTAIQHGPLPGFNDFAAGHAETTIEFEGITQQKINAAFGGKPPANLQTRYGFLGGGRSILSSPPFRMALPGSVDGAQATLSGDGLSLSVDFTEGTEQYTLSGQAPRFELAELNGAKIIFSGISFESRQQRMFKDEPLLYSGTQQFLLAEVSLDPGQEGKPKIGMKEFKYDVTVPASGEHIDLTAKLGATEFRIGDQNYGPARYDFSFRHLNARKLVALEKSMMALYAKPEVFQDPTLALQALTPLKGQLIDLLADNPEFSIDRIGFRSPEGEVNVSATVKLPGAKVEDFNNPMSLLEKLDFAAEIAIPENLAAMIQPGKATSEEELMTRKQAAEQAVSGFVQRGYATNEGGLIKTRITYRGNQLLVNDKPFNPMALAAPPR